MIFYIFKGLNALTNCGRNESNKEREEAVEKNEENREKVKATKR